MRSIIRSSVWETNSSASHSCIILSEKDMQRWEKDPKLYAVKDIWYSTVRDAGYPLNKTKLYTRDEVLTYLKNRDYNPNLYDGDFEEFIRDEGFITFPDWQEIELEEDEEKFATPSGDKMVILCKYGYDF